MLPVDPVTRCTRGARPEPFSRPLAAMVTTKTDPAVRIGDPQSQQHRGGRAPEGVSGHRDTASIQPARETRDRRLDLVEPVQDGVHVLGTRTPVQRSLRIVTLAEAERDGVQVGRLDDDETVCRPEIGQRAVAVERRQEDRMIGRSILSPVPRPSSPG